MTIRGVPLRCDPAREPCFTIVHLRSELRRSTDEPDVWREAPRAECTNGLRKREVAARPRADLREGRWEPAWQLARQCWDEPRHARFYFQRFEAMGGRKGEFPIINRQWSVAGMLDSLAARL